MSIEIDLCDYCLNERDDRRARLIYFGDYKDNDTDMWYCQHNKNNRPTFMGKKIACEYFKEGRTPLELLAKRFKEDEQ